MRFQYLLTTLFVTRAFADLTCRDFVPHNWTSPLARLYLQDDDADNPENHDPNTLPANLTITNTLTLAPKKSSGSVFRLKVCTSKSLGLNSTDTLYCEPPDRIRKRQNSCDGSCSRTFENYLQIIDTATGNCFTWQQKTPTLAYYNFVPCNPSPTNTSQIIKAERGYTYYVNDIYQPAGVCDWGVDFYMFQQEQQPYNNKGSFQPWELASNNRTVVSRREPYPNAWSVYAKHHDPLTTYQK